MIMTHILFGTCICLPKYEQVNKLDVDMLAYGVKYPFQLALKFN